MNPLTTITQNYPILSEQEERTLFLRYKEHNDLEAAQTLVLSCTRMVIKVANDFRGYVNDIEDLYQEGYIGLCRAIKSFDLSYGVRLATYAYNKIRERISDFCVRNYRIFNVATTKPQKKLFYNRELLNKDENALEKLGVSKEDYEEFKVRSEFQVKSIELDGSIMSSNGQTLGNEFDEQHAVELASDHPTPEESLIEKQDQQYLQKLKDSIALLNEREQLIIRSRYLTEEPRTLKDLSEEIGVSLERVRQVEVIALKKLREMMG